MKLNLGCGSQTPLDWTNVDYAFGARLAKFPIFKILNKKIHLFDLTWNDRIYIHDLTKRFPWKDNSVDIVYTSHTLEHFTRHDGIAFLNECCRILKKDGIIRIIVPDLSQLVRDYLEKKIRADDFVEKLGVLYKRNASPFKQYFSPFIQFPHKCMYDSLTLISILQNVGFNAVNRKPFDSDIPDIRKVELEERTEKAVIVEGRKR
jgi:SAM-dependent methyltransferase